MSTASNSSPASAGMALVVAALTATAFVTQQARTEAAAPVGGASAATNPTTVATPTSSAAANPPAENRQIGMVIASGIGLVTEIFRSLHRGKPCLDK